MCSTEILLNTPTIKEVHSIQNDSYLVVDTRRAETNVVKYQTMQFVTQSNVNKSTGQRSISIFQPTEELIKFSPLDILAATVTVPTPTILSHP